MQKATKTNLSACDPTQIKVANGCLNLVPIGRPCTNPLQCQRGSVCQDGFCVCPTNKINVNDQCVPIVGGAGPISTTPSGTTSLVAPTTPPPTTPRPTITTIAEILSIGFKFFDCSYMPRADRGDTSWAWALRYAPQVAHR